MENQITINDTVSLSVPDGGHLVSIAVTIELTPPSAGCLIYGTSADGNLGFVEVRGAKTEIDLPFVYPKIYVRYLHGLKTINLSTRGWRIAAPDFVPPKRVDLT